MYIENYGSDQRKPTTVKAFYIHFYSHVDFKHKKVKYLLPSDKNTTF